MDEETRQKYEEREEYLFERKMMLQLAEKAGMEKGIEIGREEGMAIAGRKVAINLVALGMDDDTISKVTGLSQEEVKKLRDQ
jgi:predicted transposase/invertase (TIGR01784 family)